MNILEFLRSLPWEMNTYDVTILHVLYKQCKTCKKVIREIDDEYSCEGYTLDEFRQDKLSERYKILHHLDYPDAYKIEISECKTSIEKGKIEILYEEYDYDSEGYYECESCESLEESEENPEQPEIRQELKECISEVKYSDMPDATKKKIINLLYEQLTGADKNSMSDLIRRSALLHAFNNTGIQITFDLPVEELLGEDVDIDDFTMLMQDAINAYKKMVIDTIKKQPTAYDIDKVIDEFYELRKGNSVRKYANANLTQQYVALQVTDWCNEIAEYLKAGGDI